MKTHEFRPGGGDEFVTAETKAEYTQLMIDWRWVNQSIKIYQLRFVSRVKLQMAAIMKGVNELIPDNLMRIFDANELEVWLIDWLIDFDWLIILQMLLCGLQKIDVKDWKAHTEYKGYAAHSPSVQHFWRVSD